MIHHERPQTSILLQVDIGLEHAECMLRERDYLVVRHETEELHLTQKSR